LLSDVFITALAVRIFAGDTGTVHRGKDSFRCTATVYMVIPMEPLGITVLVPPENQEAN
jgi:hypothetical protein